MPPKDTQQPPVLHWLGEDSDHCIRMGDITVLDETTLDETDLEYDHIRIKSLPTIEFTTEPVTLSVKIFLLTGKWPSNNWLRLHGLPMRRRRKRK